MEDPRKQEASLPARRRSGSGSGSATATSPKRRRSDSVSPPHRRRSNSSSATPPNRRRNSAAKHRPYQTPSLLLHDECASLTEESSSDVPLGAGSSGRVVLKKRKHGNVAVKTLFGSDVKSEVVREATLNNAAALQAPKGVAKVIGYCPEDGLLVTEVVKGKTLSKKQDPGNARDVLQVAKHLYATLQLLHDAGIYHGDISGPNILVSDDNTAKFIDFGLACDSAESCDARERAFAGNSDMHPPEWGLKNVPLPDHWGANREEMEDDCVSDNEKEMMRCFDEVGRKFGLQRWLVEDAEDRMAAKDVWSLGKVLSEYAGLSGIAEKNMSHAYANVGDALARLPNPPRRKQILKLLASKRGINMVNDKDGWGLVTQVLRKAMNPDPIKRPTAKEMVDIITAAEK